MRENIPEGTAGERPGGGARRQGQCGVLEGHRKVRGGGETVRW